MKRTSGSWAAMAGAEFRAIRKELGLTLYAWGLALGYEGNRNAVQASISRLEASEVVPERTARLARMLGDHGIPADWKR